MAALVKSGEDRSQTSCYYLEEMPCMKKDSKSVSGFLRHNRADIFSEEALSEMEKGND